MVQQKVLGVLRGQLEEAEARHRAAKERFWEVAGRPRQRSLTGGPVCNGSEAVNKAAAEEALARRMHLEAVMRLNRFLIDGTIPEDVKASLEHTRAAAAGA